MTTNNPTAVVPFGTHKLGAGRAGADHRLRSLEREPMPGGVHSRQALNHTGVRRRIRGHQRHFGGDLTNPCLGPTGFLTPPPPLLGFPKKGAYTLCPQTCLNPLNSPPLPRPYGQQHLNPRDARRIWNQVPHPEPYGRSRTISPSPPEKITASLRFHVAGQRSPPVPILVNYSPLLASRGRDCRRHLVVLQSEQQGGGMARRQASP